MCPGAELEHGLQTPLRWLWLAEDDDGDNGSFPVVLRRDFHVAFESKVLLYTVESSPGFGQV